MKLTENQLAGLQSVGGAGSHPVTTRGPMSGTTQNSLRHFGLVQIQDGRQRWATITERGLQLLTAGKVNANSLIITVPKP